MLVKTKVICEIDIEDNIYLFNFLLSTAVPSTKQTSNSLTERLVIVKRTLRPEWQNNRSPLSKIKLKAAEKNSEESCSM